MVSPFILLIPFVHLLFDRNSSWLSVLSFSFLAGFILNLFLPQAWWFILGISCVSFVVAKVFRSMVRGEGVLFFVLLSILFFIVYELGFLLYEEIDIVSSLEDLVWLVLPTYLSFYVRKD